MHFGADFEIIADALGEKMPPGADPLGQKIVQRHIDGADGRLAGRRNLYTRQECDAILKLPFRQLAQLYAFVAMIVVLQRHQKIDVGGDVARQAAGGAFQVALEKDIGDDRLQQHDRRDDDDQRAAEQPARQDALHRIARGVRHDLAPACNQPRAPSADRAAAWDLPRSCGAGVSPARRWSVPAPHSAACTIPRG